MIFLVLFMVDCKLLFIFVAMKYKKLFFSVSRVLWIWMMMLPSLPVVAQRHEVYNQRIASLQVVAGQQWQSMPIAVLGEPIHIDFDDMTHDYERYYYKVEAI